jgi:hypothetical protein
MDEGYNDCTDGYGRAYDGDLAQGVAKRIDTSLRSGAPIHIGTIPTLGD